MDKTVLVNKVSNLFRISGYKVDPSVKINHREIDIRAEETQGLVRKIILIECADYADPVGVGKVQEDFNKLDAAREHLKANAIVMHVSKNGYTPEASGYLLDKGVSFFALIDLESKLINFDSYIEAVESDRTRSIILREYQPNKIHYEKDPKGSKEINPFIEEWIKSDLKWLTVLGDYGVGKSWTLRWLLYDLISKYKKDPKSNLLPFFIPLQRFTKAFDFSNLILKTFQMYGLLGVHLSAFEYLMSQGKILFLLDSFDEMAQHLNQETIRENLKEILTGISRNSRAILTSRPNYFEGKSERLLLVEKESGAHFHPIDEGQYSHQNAMARTIQDRLEKSQFARLQDLTIEQRKKLFKIVLGENSPSYRKLIELFDRFQELESISQRAVIARLLTTVAETLSSEKETQTIDGYPLIPDQLDHLNQAKVFEIVTYNLLYRDQNIGSLSASERLYFLRCLAINLQKKGREHFATPEELKNLINEIFISKIQRTDTPEKILESYYRICRRHSGLTTEGQFQDSTGNVDFPVDERDTESRVGFSHNSLREYLVADAIVDSLLNKTEFKDISQVIVTELVAEFVVLKSEYDVNISKMVFNEYLNTVDSKFRDCLFTIVYEFIRIDFQKYMALLGDRPLLKNVDLGGLDFSAMILKNSDIIGCVALDTDFRKCNLQNSSFKSTILDGVMFDDANLLKADFRESEISSIYVYDDFVSKTTSVLRKRDARQWLYSKGALVSPTDDLNPLLGQPWYEAAREVMRTLEKNIAGSHQDVALSKGTRLSNRPFATEFVQFLITKNILRKEIKSKTGPGWVVVVIAEHRDLIKRFSQSGHIDPILEPFFKKHLPEDIDFTTSVN
jgi:uncharacterized protein YjbI with pentapeptide repeats